MSISADFLSWLCLFFMASAVLFIIIYDLIYIIKSKKL